MTIADQVTLCCVDTEHHALSAAALRRCNELMPFAKTIFVTDRADFVAPEWELHRIKTLSDYEEYNKFMLKNLYFHTETDFLLSVQFDGFVVNPAAWTDEFLEYDYIGAPWPCSWKEYAVGTGGFSLRSKKLMKALQDDRIALPQFSIAEDLCFCRTYRSYLQVHYGIRFAPVEVAERFCYESGDFVPDTFGFHGLVRLADYYVGDAAPFMIDNLKRYLMRKAEVLVLAMQYAFRHQHAEAARLFRRIAEHQTLDGAQEVLTQRGAPADTITYLAPCWARYVQGIGEGVDEAHQPAAPAEDQARMAPAA